MREREATTATCGAWSQGRGDTTSMEGNKLVSKISSLVEEDRIVALSKVLVRVNELREHFGFRVLEK
ncbi:hypothetical protein ACSQ67_014556 [Phaseolus vulgaris]